MKHRGSCVLMSRERKEEYLYQHCGVYVCKSKMLSDSVNYGILLLLTLSAHAREGYSSHFVCQSVSQSVCVSLFDFGEGAVFRVETYISIF